MKNQLKAPLALSILIVLLFSFSVVQAQKYDLKLRLEDGKSYQLQQTSEQKINISVMGMSQDINQTMVFGYTYLVEKIENGIHTIKVTYDFIESARDGAQGSFSYNSKEDTEPENPEAQYMAALIGESFHMKMDQMGNVLEVSGTDALLEKGLSKMEGLDEATQKAVKAQLKNQFGDEATKSSVGQLSAFFPKKKVKVGKSWKHDYSTKTVMALDMKSVYTLEKVEDGKAYLNITTEVIPGPTETFEMGEMSMQYSLEGVYNGTMVIDLTTGWTLEGNLDQDLGGTVQISNPSFGVVDAPMTIGSNIKIKSK